MSTNGIKAGNAFVEITTKNKGLEAGLARAQKSLANMGAGVQAVGTKLLAAGAAGTGALLATLAVFSSQGDQLQKMAIRTGIAVESLSELAYAAQQSGSSIGALEKGVRKLQQNIADAAKGTGEAKDAFAELGISVGAIASMSPEAQFLAITDKLSKVTDASKRAALAMDIFGKAGAELIPLLADGNQGIEALRKRAKALGLTMSTDSANSAAEFTDRFAELKNQVTKTAFEIGASIFPALKGIIDRTQKVMAAIIAWVQSNREAVVSALQIAAGVTVAGAALIGLGIALKAAATGIGVMLIAMAAVKASIAALGTIIAVATSPFALITAAAVAMGVAFFDLGGIASQVGQYLADVFNTLKGRAIAAFEGISAALSAGNITLAAKILWLSLKAEWERGIMTLMGLWTSFRDGFIDAWSGAVQFFAEAFIGGIGLVKIAWADFTESFKTMWNNASAGVGNFLDDWKTAISDGFTEAKNMAGFISDQERNQELQGRGIENQISKDARNKERDDANAKARKEAEASRQAAVTAVRGQLTLLEQEAQDGRDKRGGAAPVDNSALVQAQKELADAIAEAQRGAAAAADPTLPGAPARRAAEAVGEGVASAEKSRSVSGTFSARAAEGLGAGKMIVDAIKMTHEELKRIHDAIKTQTAGLT